MFTKQELTQVKSAQKRWNKDNRGEFRKERHSKFTSDEGMVRQRVYTPLDLSEKGISYTSDLGFPGEYPYTRGITSTMYRSQLPLSLHTIGRAIPEEFNRICRDVYAAGSGMVGILTDLPTQLGYDPDFPPARAEVGKVGTSLCSLRDWEVAFDGINLGKVWTHIQANAQATWALACYSVAAERQGVDTTKLEGNLQNDIFKEFNARGMYIFPPRQSLRLVTDSLVYCAEHMPRFKPLQIQSYGYSEAGANRVHEIAFTLATAVTYLEAALGRGVDIDAIAPCVMFLLSHDHIDFFDEIAKIRATRKIWATLMKERFHARKDESMKMVILSSQGGTSLVKEQYMNNIARGAITWLAGALAGCQQIGNRSYDECRGIASDEALLTALRSGQIVTHETGVCDVVDPLGGSYYVESLTCQYEEKITQALDEIAARGGMVKATEDGYVVRVIREDAYKYQKMVESGERLKVGHNIFQMPEEEKEARVYRADPKVIKKRVQDVEQFKKKRNIQKVNRTLNELKKCAAAKESNETNLMMPIMEAVKASATLGEVCGTLRAVFGEYQGPNA